MGLVYADLILKNATDVNNAKRGLINESEIRQTAVTAMVDTGSINLVINDAVRRELELELEDTREATLADGSKCAFSYTEPVQIQWKNRKTVLQAIYIPTADEILLGAIPLEALDLIVNPLKQELIGAHGDEVLLIVK